MTLKILDLFGAPGGLSLGFEMAGFKSIGVVDIFKEGVETYLANFNGAVGIIGDIRNIGVEELKEKLRYKVPDVIVGGPPCQGFSTIGRVKIASLAKRGIWALRNHHPRFIDDPRNELYREYVRIVGGFKPMVIVMENVAGMMSYRNGEIVEQIIEDFQKLGYYVEAKVLNAAEFGVPQIRKRIFFIGVRRDLGVKVRFPEPTHYLPDAPPLIALSGRKKFVSVWEAIGDLPDPVPPKRGLTDEPIPYTMEPFSEYQKWVREGSDMVHNHIARYHSKRDILVFSLMKENQKWKDLPQEIKEMYGYRDDIFADKFRKLAKNLPSWTIVAHLYKDGYMFIHPVQPRTLTVREAARLQSFPDKFVFKGSRTAQYKQVGNAVPPLLARAIAESIREMLRDAGL